MNKTKVLVFTCPKSKVGLSEKALDAVLSDVWENNYPNESNPIVKCNLSSSTTSLTPVTMDHLADEEGVFLIFDHSEQWENQPDIKAKFLNKLKEQCKGDDLYVLVHTHGPEINDFQGWTLSGRLSGSHTGTPKDHYSPLFEILTDDQPCKLYRIISTIFKPYNKLETVLQFLHGCMVPKNDDASFVAAYNKLLGEKEEIIDTVKDYYVNQYPNLLNVKGLAEVREILLRFALTKN